MVAMPVSGRMVIESLKEQAEITKEAYRNYKTQLEERDRLIREAREVRIPWSIIEEASGVSTQMASKIVKKPPAPPHGEDKNRRSDGIPE